jgi:hypothetical protein
VSAYFLVALLVAGIVVVAVRYDDINATPDANSAAQMASNPITVFGEGCGARRAGTRLSATHMTAA